MSNVKLPHWAMMALGLVAIIIAWVMDQQASGTLVLPAAAITVITLIRTVIGLLTPSVNPSTNANAVMKASAAPPLPNLNPGDVIGPGAP